MPDEWLPAREFGARVGCSDQTIIARIKAGQFDGDDVRIRPEGSRPRYFVHTRAIAGAASTGAPGDHADQLPATLSVGADSGVAELALLRDELARVRRELSDVIAERDRLRAEVSKLKDVGLHLTRATEAFLLPDTLND